MSRVYNFSAGPAVLPEEVLKEAQEEMLDYRGCGMSVMEMSHRSKVFQNIIDEAEADLRDLMGIPSNYKVLFLQGGASLQFSMIPMNLMKNGVADYIVTGQWAKKAYAEAQKYGKANKIASSEDKTFSYIPDCSDLPISPDAVIRDIDRFGEETGGDVCHQGFALGIRQFFVFGTVNGVVFADINIVGILIDRKIGAIRNIAECLILTGCNGVCGSVKLCFLPCLLCPLSGDNIIADTVLEQVQRYCSELLVSAAL